MNYEILVGDKLNFAKPAFKNIAHEKQERILKVAVEEFAQNGFLGTNINIIAKKADISIGSLYNYFETKDDLFLTVAQKGIQEMMDTVMTALSFGAANLNYFKLFLTALINFIKEEKNLCILYNEVSFQNNTDVVGEVSSYAKENLMKIYHSVIKEAQKSKNIRDDVDFRVITFLLDAVFSALRNAYTTDDEKSLRLFIPNELKNDTEYFVDQLIKLLLPSICANNLEESRA